jgi:phage-related protein
VFCGSSRKDLRNFPDDARREAGLELWAVQNDQEPSDWKPMSAIGVGVREIRIKDVTGAYRVIYVVKIKDKVMSCTRSRRKRNRRRRKT